MKTISLIIPIFNAREYLEKCLESAVSQDCENMEIICVDDGSTDGSGHILDDFAQALSDIAVIEKAPKVEGRSMTMFLTEKR